MKESYFNTFWLAYPKKKGKKDARKAWAKLNPDRALLHKMLAAIEEQKQTAQWKKNDGQFIPHPSTWLNGELWEDEITKADKAEPKPKKTKLWPIIGKVCSKEDCRLPAIYKDDSGSYTRYSCTNHLPDDVKELYE